MCKYVYDKLMANHNEWKNLRRKLEQQGLDVVKSRSSHWKVYQGKRLLTSMPSSSGGGRGLANAVAQLRREGFDV